MSVELSTMTSPSMSSAIVAILLVYTCLSPVGASQSFGADATSGAESAIRPSEFLRQQQDLVVDLPGAPPVDFKQYSGYITVDEEKGRHLFYWFVEAASDPDEKPLTLWLNGGPGCSSLAGSFSELGPFYPNASGTGLIQNEYSWNQISNIIFLESPAGVGFSYSETPSDYVTGDAKTASDSRLFLLGWLERFPHFKTRPFYITGESYAGHYIPDLAALLQRRREEDEPALNFKGFLLGNPWSDPSSDFKGMADFYWSRSLISTHTYDTYLAQCSVSDYYTADMGEVCYDLTVKFFDEAGPLNPYDVYVDVCTGYRGQEQRLMEKRGFRVPRNVTRQPLPPSRPIPTLSSPLGASIYYDACIDQQVEKYFNLPAVQTALHAAKLPYRWADCTDLISYSEEDALQSKLPVFQELLKTSLRMTIFSGDVDSVCPTMGTRHWLYKLDRKGDIKLSQKWRPWYVEQQVGGYVEEYNEGQFKFITVRNAGHMVPYFQPVRALEIFKQFIEDGHMAPFGGSEVESGGAAGAGADGLVAAAAKAGGGEGLVMVDAAVESGASLTI